MTRELLDFLVELGPVNTGLRAENAATADEYVGLQASVARATATFLAAELFGRVSDLTAVLGLGGTLALVGEVLDDIKIDSVVIGFDTEDLLVKDNLLSGISSVYFQYWQFHN
jgi:hypothetical protein